MIQRAYDAGYKRIFISERPRALQSDCYSRLAVKSHWPLKRFIQALNGTLPATEKVTGLSKRIIKRVFGGGVYDWVRRIFLRM